MKWAKARSSPRVRRARSKKWRCRMSGSRVDPDLLDTMNRVLAGSIWRSIRRICAGSVESRISSRGKPGWAPKVSASTSGPRLDPPMPSRTALANPAAFTSAWKASRASRSIASPLPASSQPSQPASSWPVQSDASRPHRRRTHPPARARSSASSTSAWRSAPMMSFCGFSRSPSCPARLAATAPRS